ncbi:MAG TPA: N-acyl homoserine lactonase family protein [Solirubrobacteraceae bacterium]
MAAATHPRRATLPLPGGSEGAGVVVTPMRAGEMRAMPHFFQRPSGPLARLRGSGLLTPKRKWTWVPIPCFLVEHPQGPILIDTGLPALVRESVAKALGRRAAIAFDVRLDEGAAVTEQLAARGIDPLSIGVVVMTHLHYDHTGSVEAFARSTFVCDAREWEAAISGGLLQGYRRRLFDRGYDWRTLDFGAPQVDSFASFGRAVDLFGDGSVRLLSTPGHTKGHMSVLLRLRSGRELLLTADASYARRTIDEELVPVWCEDVHRYMRSLREIRRYLELTPSALVICGHDPEGWEQVRERYE